MATYDTSWHGAECVTEAMGLMWSQALRDRTPCLTSTQDPLLEILSIVLEWLVLSGLSLAGLPLIGLSWTGLPFNGLP